MLQKHANGVIGEIEYIEDPRTHLCFAYFHDDRGMALTLVPRASIPDNMLTTAEIEKNK